MDCRGNEYVEENWEDNRTMYLVWKINRFLNNTGNWCKETWGTYKNNKAERKG